MLLSSLKKSCIKKEGHELELKGVQTFLWAPLVMDVWEEEEEEEEEKG